MFILGHLMIFSGAKMQDLGLFGGQKACFAHRMAFWGPLEGSQRFKKCVSDAYSVMLGQLDHYVVFGTKSGAVQDFQRGKKCQIGVE